jgi:hypothetical protein
MSEAPSFADGSNGHEKSRNEPLPESKMLTFATVCREEPHGYRCLVFIGLAPSLKACASRDATVVRSRLTGPGTTKYFATA